MNSTVRLRDPTTGEPAIYTLVYPDEADIRRNRLSILAPIGTAIFGFRVGDEVRWPTPNGWRKKIQVESVLLQPEREAAMRF
jgi:regulator of nucleoside diphosphate kinase